MNAMTCQEVEEQLDLLAAGACDPPVRVALETHLAQCQTCAAHYAESQRTLGLLDLHFQHDGLGRLQQRIEEESRPRRRMRIFTPFVRSVALVAAVVLVAVGLIWWLPRDNPDRPDTEPQFALLVQAGKTRQKVDLQAPGLGKEKSAEAVAVVPLAARGGDTLRTDLVKAQREGKLPLPPEVTLELVLVNTGQRAVEVRLGDERAELALEVAGDGVVRIPAPKADTPAVLRPQTLLLNAGKQHVFLIDRLIAGSPGKLEFIYVTEPGEYKLTARLRLTADGRAVTVTGETVRIKVEK